MSAAAVPTEALLQARDISVRYGHVEALQGVDLEVFPNEVVVLAGENGAGKSSLVRCIAGDRAPDRGAVLVRGHALRADPRSAARLGVAVVWQDLALCDNLDIASNLLLGRETGRLMLSDSRFYSRGGRLLADLGIDLPPPTTRVDLLSGGQRQLVAVARAMRDRPVLLILDEPTASLGVRESARVEALAASLPAQGTAVLLVTHDVEQMFRLADRIVILRRGRLLAEIRPEESHPDEVAALLSGQGLDGSARRQLSRLQSLTDQLSSAEPSSSLDLIVSALGAALGLDQICVHVAEGGNLKLAASSGLTRRMAAALSAVASGPAGGQIGRASADGEPVTTEDVMRDPAWMRMRADVRHAGVAASWSVPFTGASGDRGVITVMRRQAGLPSRDQLELASLYAGFAAGALERDRLLGEVTSRNRVLETIRDVLQVLAGPAPTESGLMAALRALEHGLGASAVLLVTSTGDEAPEVRASTGGSDEQADPGPSAVMLEKARTAIAGSHTGESPTSPAGPEGDVLAAAFPAPGGTAALVVQWAPGADERAPDRRALLDDAANSLRLALEREESERAQREAMALRSSQELQRRFLSWLSHELRTPLTAIRGYASSLMQPDVAWDGSDQQRFLERISDESARLGRLVGDLLDFSAIDAGILRLHRDWSDLRLVLEAARACLPAGAAARVEIDCPDTTVVWADHDRLEQIFLNLLDNAVRHNPPVTRVTVRAWTDADGVVAVEVSDDGVGIPPEVAGGRPRDRSDRRSRTSGAGIGLSIARGIVEAHGGRFAIEPLSPGTRCIVRIPAGLDAAVDGAGESDSDGEKVAAP